MLHVFFSSDWADAFKDSINGSLPYRQAAKNWEGDFWFVAAPDQAGQAHQSSPGDVDGSLFLYIDLWHGECRSAEMCADSSAHAPEFRITATPRNWVRVLRRELDPIRAMLTGALKLEGNMAKVMRNVRAANELVLCATRVPTILPDL